MIARKSFLEVSSQRISRLSNESRRDSLIKENKLEWSFLRSQCKKLELENFYQAYMQRLRISYLKLFIIIQLLVMGVHSTILLITTSDFNRIAIDIFVYVLSALLVWGLLALNFQEELIRRCSWLTYVTSWLAVTILTVMDIGVTVHHVVTTSHVLTPFFGSSILYAVYIFMPLRDSVHVFALGMFVTISYLLNYAFVTYCKLLGETETLNFTKFLSEGIFLLSVNFLGICFRLMREIDIRITFLDRRKYIEENLALRYAREEEQRLFLSIIPAHVANKIEHHVKSRLQKEVFKRRASAWRLCQRRKLFIEPHDNVTILYADIVNYTSLTTTLDVKTLVETLHDMFVKFDTASEEYNVLRIKFLGDCYYAVAGLFLPNDYHAKSCVNLGLHMISIIHDIRKRREFNIDMRIGIHTGSVLSGVIGARKLQYDIWSKDADIASCLEQTGVAGRVHVSEETLKQLKGEYLYEQGTRQAEIDPVLKKFGIRTFLIKLPADTTYDAQKHESILPDTTTNFMQSNIQQFNKMRIQTKLELNRELDKMPIGEIDFGLEKSCSTCGNVSSKHTTLDEMEESDIAPFCLFFKDWHCEMQFLGNSDDMLKYGVIMGTTVFVAISAMQVINTEQSAFFWPCTAFYTVILLTCIFFTWFKKLWSMLFSKELNSLPQNTFTLFLFNISKKMQKYITARIIIYLLIISIHFSSTFIQLFDHKSQHNDLQICEISFNTWGITESIELALCSAFLFSHIPFVLKLTVGILISITYSIVIYASNDHIYEDGPSTNVGLQEKYSHIMAIIITFAVFYLMDRQTEFISKIDYNLKRQLLRKQEDAEITNASIKMLLNNILPSHVANIYISKQMKNELYYEECDNVAVMFASIKNYEAESVGLKILNEIICDFDEVLTHFEEEGMFKVEKIKVAGWTYMAACGLDLYRSENRNSQTNLQGSTLQPNGLETKPTSSDNMKQEMVPSTSQTATKKFKKLSISFPQQNYIVHVMVQFALELMKTLHCFNVKNQEDNLGHGMLRIGISHGSIMAGVIGSSKPHYDIWGNCVNMASRMDCTGIPGRIQVTKDTADILSTFNIQCDFRGMTYVKGRGEIPTYFVGIDEQFNFIPDKKSAESA